MLRQALQLAEAVNARDLGTDVAGVLEQPGTVTTDEMLERAANLAEHAAAELRDELFTSKGWPS